MKIIQIAAGMLFLILAAICPLPPMLAVPGVVWRSVIGLLSCTAIFAGVSRGKGREE